MSAKNNISNDFIKNKGETPHVFPGMSDRLSAERDGTAGLNRPRPADGAAPPHYFRFLSFCSRRVERASSSSVRFLLVASRRSQAIFASTASER